MFPSRILGLHWTNTCVTQVGEAALMPCLSVRGWLLLPRCGLSRQA